MTASTPPATGAHTGATRPQRSTCSAQRWRYLALNSAAFALLYTLCNAHAAALNAHAPLPSVASAWDAHTPFVPWLILAYGCSGPLFVLSFLITPCGAPLRALSARVLSATVLASAVFCYWPLRLSHARPRVSGWLAWPYRALDLVDQPFNQLPSLHITYCALFWFALKPVARTARLKSIALFSLLSLISLSTVLIYQHHLLDVAAGMLLGAGLNYVLSTTRFQVISAKQQANTVALHYALAAGAVWIASVCVSLALIGGYLGVSLLLVSAGYWRQNPAFLGKRGGGFSLASWLLFAPYLAGYWLTWRAVCWRERHTPTLQAVAPGVWQARRLTHAQALQLPAHCAIIDVSAELSETALLRRQPYYFFPLLDLVTPDAKTLDRIAEVISGHRRAGQAVLVHCSMGYSRSQLVLRHWLAQAETHGLPTCLL
jgi:membrane-associated phospholipid phosphatase